MLKKICLTITITITTIILINLTFISLIHAEIYPFKELYQNGLIKHNHINNVTYVFAHGHYEYICQNQTSKKCLHRHVTTINQEKISTLTLLKQLKKKNNPKKIWVSMCETGNQEYIQKTPTKITPWPEYVDRNKEPGITYVVFTGMNLQRFSAPKNGWLHHFALELVR